MQKLAELCVRRPVFATVIILALVVVGAFSYLQLGVDRFPDVDFPFVTITTVLPGAAPEEIETEITDKIEEAVNTISGIEELISTSSENVSLTRSTRSWPISPRTPTRRSSRRSTRTPTRSSRSRCRARSPSGRSPSTPTRC
jgi:multidrug efflux pump subunit AcrB